METSKIIKENNEITNEDDVLLQKKLDIVLLFNELLEYTYSESHQKLIIKENEKSLIFELLQSRLRTLELTANEKEDSSEEIFAINLFKILFKDKKDLNVENFDEKKEYFKLLLRVLNEEPLNIFELKKLFALREETKKYEINKLLTTIFQNYSVINDVYEGYFIFCFCLINKYMKSNSILIDSFITYVKNEINCFNKKLVFIKDYQDEEIEKMSKDAIIDDLISIYGKIGKFGVFLSLYMENNHLKLRKIQDEEKNKISNKSKKKNNQNIDNDEIEGNKEEEENKVCAILNDENYYEEKGKSFDEILKDYKNSQLFKEIKKVDDLIGKELSLEEKINKLFEIVRIQQIEQELQEKELRALLGEFQSHEKNIKSIGNKIRSLSGEFQEQENALNNNMQEINRINHELIIIKNKLKINPIKEYN